MGGNVFKLRLYDIDGLEGTGSFSLYYPFPHLRFHSISAGDRTIYSPCTNLYFSFSASAAGVRDFISWGILGGFWGFSSTIYISSSGCFC